MSAEALFGASSSAVLSDCGIYRYRLSRWWGIGKSALFVMLNPSTADADIDDPTIRRCVGFAKSWGCGSLEVVNLYAYRATDPRALRAVGYRAVGPENDSHIRAACMAAADGLIVAAWGASAKDQGRIAAVRRLLIPHAPVKALGLTADGSPRHPLYVQGGAPLIDYIPAVTP